jgi:beta-glucanase (GH16 family)
MYPEDETYGIWPRSGEIDIALARGNEPSISGNGRDTVTSTLHWGSSGPLDQSDRTTGNMTIRRNDLSDGFHTFGMEWSEDHLFTWVDDRVVQPMSTKFGEALGTMYTRAQYLLHWVLVNGTYVK